ncbi:hypothetical protein [Helicobacter pylori]|uniref:hypothetical protein n=1 Tax=Helicobacter pylori TaxID=210 RepID=UPI00046389DC|nr:hypothetical protein [Helicobacter pylori]
MQLFEKWQSVTDAYKSFYEEGEHLGLEVSIFLKHFCEAKECLSLVKQYRDNKRDCAVWIIDFLIVELLKCGGFDD